MRFISICPARVAAVLTVLATTTILAGCSMGSGPSSGSTNYQQGKLGNGAFLFTCDDSVTCDPYSNSAENFPTRIAQSSTFRLRFVPNDQQGIQTDLDGPEHTGITLQSASDTFLTMGPTGFLAKGAGFGTVLALDGRGWVIDYATITVSAPKELAIVDPVELPKSRLPERFDTLKLKVDDTRDLVAVAVSNDGELMAGAFTVDWEPEDTSVAEVSKRSRGIVNATARKAGKTVLHVKGAGLTKDVEVEVEAVSQ